MQFTSETSCPVVCVTDFLLMLSKEKAGRKHPMFLNSFCKIFALSSCKKGLFMIQIYMYRTVTKIIETRLFFRYTLFVET